MATTDENGNIISREQVTPYGDSLGKRDSTNSVAVGSPEHGPGYTGHVRDKDLGLTYMQARYYDPTIGRFMGADPVGFLDTEDPAYFNRYSYVNNNPYTNIDPTGMSTGTTGDDEIGSESLHVRPEAGSPTNDSSNSFNGVSWNNNNVNYIGLDIGSSDSIVESLLLGVGGLRGAGRIKPGVIAKRPSVAKAATSRPDFDGTSKGDLIGVPKGASGPHPTTNKRGNEVGLEFTGGKGGNGMNSRVDGVRIMEANQHQGRRAVYMNEGRQIVDVSTGRTLSNGDPRAHHYLRE